MSVARDTRRSVSFVCSCVFLNYILTHLILLVHHYTGKDQMVKKEYQKFGSTTACTLRAVDRYLEFEYYPIEEDNDEEDEDNTQEDRS